MSNLELEKAAIAPRRWIELCGAFEKQHLNETSAILCPRATRHIDDLLGHEVNYFGSDFLIVPGGRYLVSSSFEGISVSDLGYTSSADCKLIASAGGQDRYNKNVFIKGLQATADGMGLIILWCS